MISFLLLIAFLALPVMVLRPIVIERMRRRAVDRELTQDENDNAGLQPDQWDRAGE